MKQWKWLVILKNLRSFVIILVTVSIVERDKDKVSKLHINNSSYFEISGSIF